MLQDNTTPMAWKRRRPIVELLKGCGAMDLVVEVLGRRDLLQTFHACYCGLVIDYKESLWSGQGAIVGLDLLEVVDLEVDLDWNYWKTFAC